MIYSGKKSYLLFLLILIVVLLGVGIDMMDIDASQYASISREMLEHNDMLQIFDLGKDYLDKPPFLFWVSALSIKIFGANNWGYKLPSILFSILSICL
jgi:4-amino-4-deoxy-L-arabinose transferase-like glycosyltransferase